MRTLRSSHTSVILSPFPLRITSPKHPTVLSLNRLPTLPFRSSAVCHFLIFFYVLYFLLYTFYKIFFFHVWTVFVWPIGTNNYYFCSEHINIYFNSISFIGFQSCTYLVHFFFIRMSTPPFFFFFYSTPICCFFSTTFSF